MTAGRGFTEAQRAELRNAVARSRLEAQAESRRLAAVYREKQRRTVEHVTKPPAVEAPGAPTALDLAGLLAETVTALELSVADLDDDEVSAATFLVRLKVSALGDLLARRNRNTNADGGSVFGRTSAAVGRKDSNDGS